MKPSQRGQSLVEGTLVMLVFFALLLGVVDFGLLMYSHQSLTERSRAALRWGTLHPETGSDSVRNMVLYGAPETSTSPTFLGLAPENILVTYSGADDASADVETLHLEIVNFEAPLFAPWWPGLAHKLMNPRPVSMTAPVVASTAVSYPR